jgi:hypothetical protein
LFGAELERLLNEAKKTGAEEVIRQNINVTDNATVENIHQFGKVGGNVDLSSND